MIGSSIGTSPGKRPKKGHAAVVERCQGTGVVEQIPSALLKARELAQDTLKKASQIAVISLIERYFGDYQAVK
jgi:hypothetical protein